MAKLKRTEIRFKTSNKNVLSRPWILMEVPVPLSIRKDNHYLSVFDFNKIKDQSSSEEKTQYHRHETSSI